MRVGFARARVRGIKRLHWDANVCRGVYDLIKRREKVRCMRRSERRREGEQGGRREGEKISCPIKHPEEIYIFGLIPPYLRGYSAAMLRESVFAGGTRVR